MGGIDINLDIGLDLAVDVNLGFQVPTRPAHILVMKCSLIAYLQIRDISTSQGAGLGYFRVCCVPLHVLNPGSWLRAP